MRERFKGIKRFAKDEIVLCVAAVFAIATMFIVPPAKGYLDYIDFRVLALLFSLMLVVSGFSSVGVFEALFKLLMKKVHTLRTMVLILVMVCFILSMWITNDVALITFVPFAIMVLKKTGQTKIMPYVIVMQTIAANLGSMCTPIGNPQNLYLYTVSGMSIFDFMKILLPYTIISFILIIISCFVVKNEKIEIAKQENEEAGVDLRRAAVFGVLFVISMLTVLRVIHYLVMLIVVVGVVLIVSPRLLKKADYMLLLTFVAFFVFVGNIKQIEVVNSFLQKCVIGNEILVSVIASQGISNVPAAVLLSGFTKDYAGLMIGTNIGGLGTIIASMASLISYKLYAKEPDCKVSGYMGLFTVMNILFLAVMIIAAVIL